MENMMEMSRQFFGFLLWCVFDGKWIAFGFTAFLLFGGIAFRLIRELRAERSRR